MPADVSADPPRLATKYALLQRADNQAADRGFALQVAKQGMIVNRPDAQLFRARLGAHYARFRALFGDAAWTLLERYAGKLG